MPRPTLAEPGTAPAPSRWPNAGRDAQPEADSDFKPLWLGRGSRGAQRRYEKLFADPHFNVMDGLDIYIDDLPNPAPCPPSCCARWSAPSLQMVEEEKPASGEPPGAPSAQAAPGEPGEVPTSQSAGLAEPVPPAQPPALPEPARFGQRPFLTVSPDFCP